jgi:hypothetical protein
VGGGIVAVVDDVVLDAGAVDGAVDVTADDDAARWFDEQAANATTATATAVVVNRRAIRPTLPPRVVRSRHTSTGTDFAATDTTPAR